MDYENTEVPRQEQGLIAIYKIERFDGKPVGEGVFLEFNDPASWAALRTWADTMAQRGYIPLAVEVREKVNEAVERKELERRQKDLNSD